MRRVFGLVAAAGCVTLPLLGPAPARAEMATGTWPGKLTFADDGQHDDLELVISREGASDTAVLRQGDVDHALKDVRNSEKGLTFSWGNDRCTLEEKEDGSFAGPCKNEAGKATVVIEIFARHEQPDDAVGDDGPIPGEADGAAPANDEVAPPAGDAEPKSPEPARAPAPDDAG